MSATQRRRSPYASALLHPTVFRLSTRSVLSAQSQYDRYTRQRSWRPTHKIEHLARIQRNLEHALECNEFGYEEGRVPSQEGSPYPKKVDAHVLLAKCLLSLMHEDPKNRGIHGHSCEEQIRRLKEDKDKKESMRAAISYVMMKNLTTLADMSRKGNLKEAFDGFKALMPIIWTHDEALPKKGFIKSFGDMLREMVKKYPSKEIAQTACWFFSELPQGTSLHILTPVVDIALDVAIRVGVKHHDYMLAFDLVRSVENRVSPQESQAYSRLTQATERLSRPIIEANIQAIQPNYPAEPLLPEHAIILGLHPEKD